MRLLALAASLALADCQSAPVETHHPAPVTVTALVNCGEPLGFQVTFDDGHAEFPTVRQLHADPELAQRFSVAVTAAKHLYSVDVNIGCDHT